jgi:hypothetical protein
VLALVGLTTGCGSGTPPHKSSRQPVAHPAAAAPPAARAASAVKAAPAAPATEAAPDDADLAGLSAAQRRAYDLGYRDCSHGRYAPANHLEAYRIGCGAAHDRAGSGRPQG